MKTKSQKFTLIICLLFSFFIIPFGAIYYLIHFYMKKCSQKTKEYMFELIHYKIIKNNKDFKVALIQYEKKMLFQSSKIAFLILIISSTILFLISIIFLKGDLKSLFSEVYQLFPILKWPTVGEVNQSILNESLKMHGPKWLPVCIFPTILFKNPDFSSWTLYISLIYFICCLFALYLLCKATIGGIARYKIGQQMSAYLFNKSTNGMDLESILLFSQSLNSKIPTQNTSL